MVVGSPRYGLIISTTQGQENEADHTKKLKINNRQNWPTYPEREVPDGVYTQLAYYPHNANMQYVPVRSVEVGSGIAVSSQFGLFRYQSLH